MNDSITRNFHLPLPDETYQSIRSEAQRRKRPATVLVREVIEQWLARQRAERLHAEISDYAAKHAGTPIDLDLQLEVAGIEALTGSRAKSTHRRTKRKGK
jgi:hypothetical protein